MAGAVLPSRGTIRVDGEDLATAPRSARAKVGFADQPPQLYEFFTVEEHVGFVAEARGANATAAAAVLAELAALRSGPAPRISGTQMLRVIGSAAILPPDVHVAHLRALLAGAGELATLSGQRLYVTGSAHEHAEFYELIESMGAVIVGEDHGWGDPVHEGRPAVGTDWLDALATSVRIAIEEGHFRADVDAAQVAFELYGIMSAAHSVGRLFADPRAAGWTRRAIDGLIARCR